MDELPEFISVEREYIERTLSLLDSAMSLSPKSEVELAAIAAFLHNFYNGIDLTRQIAAGVLLSLVTAPPEYIF